MVSLFDCDQAWLRLMRAWPSRGGQLALTSCTFTPIPSTLNVEGNQRQMDRTGANNIAVSRDGNGPDEALAEAARRSPARMINDDAGALAGRMLSRRTKQNLSSEDSSTSSSKVAAVDEHLPDQLVQTIVDSPKMSPQSSVRCERGDDDGTEKRETLPSMGSNQVICRDSNDNLVQMDDKLESLSLERSEKIGNSGSKLSGELMDERHMDTTNENVPGKQLEQKFDAHLSKLEPGEETHSELPAEIAGEPRRQLRPATNLIRRDESWHSLLALNQIGTNNNNQQQGELRTNIYGADANETHS